MQMNSVPIGLGALVVALLLFVTMAPGRPQQDKPNDPPAATTVTGSGCVEAGVEAGCIVVHDSKTNKLYNLYFTEKRPEIGTGIHFEGTKHGGVTTCMQGEPVKVSNWSRVEMSCAAQRDPDK
jgi:hypothetical protein